MIGFYALWEELLIHFEECEGKGLFAFSKVDRCQSLMDEGNFGALLELTKELLHMDSNLLKMNQLITVSRQIDHSVVGQLVEFSRQVTRQSMIIQGLTNCFLHEMISNFSAFQDGLDDLLDIYVILLIYYGILVSTIPLEEITNLETLQIQCLASCTLNLPTTISKRSNMRKYVNIIPHLIYQLSVLEWQEDEELSDLKLAMKYSLEFVVLSEEEKQNAHYYTSVAKDFPEVSIEKWKSDWKVMNFVANCPIQNEIEDNFIYRSALLNVAWEQDSEQYTAIRLLLAKSYIRHFFNVFSPTCPPLFFCFKDTEVQEELLDLIGERHAHLCTETLVDFVKLIEPDNFPYYLELVSMGDVEKYTTDEFFNTAKDNFTLECSALLFKLLTRYISKNKKDHSFLSNFNDTFLSLIEPTRSAPIWAIDYCRVSLDQYPCEKLIKFAQAILFDTSRYKCPSRALLFNCMVKMEKLKIQDIHPKKLFCFVLDFCGDTFPELCSLSLIFSTLKQTKYGIDLLIEICEKILTNFQGMGVDMVSSESCRYFLLLSSQFYELGGAYFSDQMILDFLNLISPLSFSYTENLACHQWSNVFNETFSCVIRLLEHIADHPDFDEILFFTWEAYYKERPFSNENIYWNILIKRLDEKMAIW